MTHFTLEDSVRRLVMSVGWLALASVLHAQSDWTAVHQLTAGTSRVRIEAGNRRGAGVVNRVTDSEITITNEHGDIAYFNRQDVQRVELILSRSNARPRGTIIGFLAGAGLSAIATASSGERGDRRKHELPLIYGVTMGGGALLGRLLAEKERTRVIYTR